MKTFLIGILGCMTISSGYAFGNPIDIKGKITDTNLQILESATIAVYKQDTVLVNGTISHAEGLFELKGLLLTLIK